MSREWQSPNGKRWVEGTFPDGRLSVRTEGVAFAQVLPPAELEREIHRDEANARSRRMAHEAHEHEKAVEAEALAGKRGLHGFTANMPSVKARKIEEALDKTQGFSGKFMKRRKFIEQAVADGATIGTSRGKRVLELASGSFFTERDVTATGIDYAEYLIEMRG